MRIVRNRSIPNVDSERLIDDLFTLHDMLHTPQGLRVFDGPRRQLVDLGMKARLIHAELVRRGDYEIFCRFCDHRIKTP